MKLSALIIVAALSTLGIGAATAQGPAPTAGVIPDRHSYAAGEPAMFRGLGFSPGETVTFQVTHVRGTPVTGENHTPAAVMTDPSGGFVATWLVCATDCVGEMLRFEATGQTSGNVGRAMFLAMAAPPRSGTRVRTDKADYAPGSTATITGAGFQAGEGVTLEVHHADGTPDSGEDHAPWSVFAGADGELTTTWHVCVDDCLGSTLRVSAVGVTSGRTAQALFTDAAAAPTFERINSFGGEAVGAYPFGGLMQGTDGALYGTASNGGAIGYGTVFRVNTDGTGFTVLKSFDYYNGAHPYARLIQGTDGALYGTTYYGGSSGYGTAFKLNTDGTGYTVLQNFDYSTTGGYVYAGLMQGSDGALYGTAYQGGTVSAGTAFKLNTNGTGFTVLKHFDYSTTGGYPFGGLMQGSDGVLYGTASSGGTSGNGTAFKLNTDGTGYTVLQNFGYSTTGGSLQGGLIQGTDGALYGTARVGGSSGYGTAFKLNTNGTGFTVLRNFDFSSGAYPYSQLVQGTDGAIYGTTYYGGSSSYGTAFKLNTDGTGYSVLQNFDYYTTGGYVYAGLVQGSDGVLYGTAYQGGSSGAGTAFKLNTNGTGFAVLQNFTYGGDISAGAYPYGEVVQGTDGAIYGTTYYGGSYSYGTVFKLNPDGTGYTVIKNMDYNSGRYPYGRLIQGTDGALYGTASQGYGDYGTAFKLNTDGSGFTVLQNFDYYTTGGYVYAGLMQGSDGALYGTAYQGGSSGAGTAFKLNTNGSGFTVLQNFDYSSGGYPWAGLMQGSDGVLYGTSTQGGTDGVGVAFKLNTDGTGFAVLQNFDYYTTGAYPYGGLIQGTDDALYGTAYYAGPSGYGTAFRLNTNGTGFAVLQNFDYSSGAYPIGGLVQATDGVLYGTTYYGGTSGVGTAFKLNPDGSDFGVLQNFDGPSGAYPYCGLTQGTDGNLYGTTTSGGNAGLGTVFRLVFENTPFTVTGRVSASCPAAGTGLLGVTVDAFEVGSGDLIGNGVTNATGDYSIADLPGGSSYTITVVTPLGYSAATAEVQVDDGATPVDFSLECVAAAGTPKSMGFWKHNVGVATGGRGSAQVGATTICSHLDLIAAHFNSNAINQVVVYQPPVSGVCADKLQVAKLLLDLKGSVGMLARAKQQLMSLLLNVAAGNIHQTAVISADGATVSQAITYCDNQIDSPTGDHERAKTIADLINNGQQVPNGMVPLGTQVISYRLRPAVGTPTFALEGVRPNPAIGNGLNVAFALPTDASAQLELLDLRGRRVMSREVGSLGAGPHTLNLAEGRKMAPGIYWVRLTQGANQRSTRVAVIE